MKNIIIIGNSGAAKECYCLLQRMQGYNTEFIFKGFLSFEGYEDNLGELSSLSLGIDDNYEFNINDYAVIGIASPLIRKKVYDKLKNKDINMFNLIAPSAIIDKFTTIGECNVITDFCFISVGVNIGNANYLNTYTEIGHDVKIGNFNFFAPRTTILGNVNLGSLNSFGTSSVALPNSKIGNFNTITPASIIYKGCKNNNLYHGNPAIKECDI